MWMHRCVEVEMWIYIDVWTGGDVWTCGRAWMCMDRRGCVDVWKDLLRDEKSRDLIVS